MLKCARKTGLCMGTSLGVLNLNVLGANRGYLRDTMRLSFRHRLVFSSFGMSSEAIGD